jgi:hypothetical protein
MYTEPIILPLDRDKTIFAMHLNGGIIGAGSREVCELLVHIIIEQTTHSLPEDVTTQTRPRANLRAAIVI